MKMRYAFVVLCIVGLYPMSMRAEIVMPGEIEPEEIAEQPQEHEFEPQAPEELQEHDIMMPGEEEPEQEPVEPEPFVPVSEPTVDEHEVSPASAPLEEPAVPTEPQTALPQQQAVPSPGAQPAEQPHPNWHTPQEEFPVVKPLAVPGAVPSPITPQGAQPAVQSPVGGAMPQQVTSPIPNVTPVGMPVAGAPFEPARPLTMPEPQIGMPAQKMAVQKPMIPQVPSYEEHVQPAAMPVMPGQQAAPTAQQADDTLKLGVTAVHQIDLDTLSIEGSGNWLEKRIWYEKAEQVFTKLRGLVAQTVDASGKFLTSSNVAFEKVHTFYATAGVEDGKLEAKIAAASDELQAMTVKQGDLTVEEKAQRQTITQSQQELKQITKGLKFLQDIEDKIDETVQQAFKTVAQARSYETKAWNNFVAIAKEIDDKKARSLYYEMESFEKNILERKSYLEQKLLPYLQNELIQRAYRSIQKVQALVQGLQQKGIDLEKQLDADKAGEPKNIQAHEKLAQELAAKEAQEKSVRDEQVRKAAQNKGFMGRMRQVGNAISHWTCCAFSKIGTWFCDAGCFVTSFFSKKAEKQVAK